MAIICSWIIPHSTPALQSCYVSRGIKNYTSGEHLLTLWYVLVNFRDNQFSLFIVHTGLRNVFHLCYGQEDCRYNLQMFEAFQVIGVFVFFRFYHRVLKIIFISENIWRILLTDEKFGLTWKPLNQFWRSLIKKRPVFKSRRNLLRTVWDFCFSNPTLLRRVGSHFGKSDN